MTHVISDPDGIDLFRLKTLRQAIKLEAVGLKRRGRSALSIVKSEFGFSGNRKFVLEQLDQVIKQKERA